MGQKHPSDEDEGRNKARDGPRGSVCRFPLLVALLQLLLGVAVAAVAFLMMAVTPSLHAREAPHWAGISLCVVSILGLVLYCVTYRPDERSSAQFICTLLFFTLCTVGLVVSVLVMAFAGYHYSQSSMFTCERVGAGCTCSLDQSDPIGRTFTYEDVGDCEEITGTLTMYFLLQVVLNVIQALVCAVGAFLVWKDRYQFFFAGLQTGPPSPGQWQKV
ncbi:sarcospan [Brachionichthys hirsutus]|uniref:sarcospan n=1 Tax=Brachionichthys hirsutus TaxID=412623 RepID=UPI003604A799